MSLKVRQFFWFLMCTIELDHLTRLSGSEQKEMASSNLKYTYQMVRLRSAQYVFVIFFNITACVMYISSACMHWARTMSLGAIVDNNGEGLFVVVVRNYAIWWFYREQVSLRAGVILNTFCNKFCKSHGERPVYGVHYNAYYPWTKSYRMGKYINDFLDWN